MSDDLITDLDFLARVYEAREPENLVFREFVKVEVDLSDRRLNTMVRETTDEVWAHIDCRTCANCCKTRYTLFTRAEIIRIAEYLGTTLEDLRARYLTYDGEEGRYTTQDLPCPFLKDNLCSIYEVRPAVCAGYPHLNRNFRSRLLKTLENNETCPIVYNVLERLKRRLGFHAKEKSKRR